MLSYGQVGGLRLVPVQLKRWPESERTAVNGGHPSRPRRVPAELPDREADTRSRAPHTQCVHAGDVPPKGLHMQRGELDMQAPMHRPEWMRIRNRSCTSAVPPWLLRHMHSPCLQMYTEMRNTKKLKELYQRALTIKSAIPHPRIMGIIRECGGKMHMHERLWSEAATDFFEVTPARVLVFTTAVVLQKPRLRRTPTAVGRGTLMHVRAQVSPQR